MADTEPDELSPEAKAALGCFLDVLENHPFSTPLVSLDLNVLAMQWVLRAPKASKGVEVLCATLDHLTGCGLVDALSPKRYRLTEDGYRLARSLH